MGKILMTSTPILDGCKILEYKGLITARVVTGSGFFSDMFAGISDFVGGKSGTYQKQLKSLNDEVLKLLEEEAISKQANAIIGVSIDYDEISGKGKQMFMVSAIGTAVIVSNQDKEEETLDNFGVKHDLYSILAEFIKNEQYSTVKVVEIENCITEAIRPEYRVKLLVLSFYEKIAKYGKAEDVLYELLEEKQYSSEIVNVGMDFYNKLLLKSDDELIKGNLPRDEIIDSLKKLKKNEA